MKRFTLTIVSRGAPQRASARCAPTTHRAARRSARPTAPARSPSQVERSTAARRRARRPRASSWCRDRCRSGSAALWGRKSREHVRSLRRSRRGLSSTSGSTSSRKRRRNSAARPGCVTARALRRRARRASSRRPEQRPSATLLARASRSTSRVHRFDPSRRRASEQLLARAPSCSIRKPGAGLGSAVSHGVRRASRAAPRPRRTGSRRRRNASLTSMARAQGHAGARPPVRRRSDPGGAPATARGGAARARPSRGRTRARRPASRTDRTTCHNCRSPSGLTRIDVNECPQPQRDASCGFLNLKPWNISVFS